MVLGLGTSKHAGTTPTEPPWQGCCCAEPVSESISRRTCAVEIASNLQGCPERWTAVWSDVCRPCKIPDTETWLAKLVSNCHSMCHFYQKIRGRQHCFVPANDSMSKDVLRYRKLTQPDIESFHNHLKSAANENSITSECPTVVCLYSCVSVDHQN